MASMAESVYTINVNDIIESVDANWLAFARDNGAPELTESAVVGKPLFDYLAGEETQRLYRIVQDRVRRTGKIARIPFRCDGPTVRRFMEMRLTPLEQGKIEYAGRTIREEERPAVRLFDPTFPRGEQGIVVCVWCKKIQLEGDLWLEAEEAIDRLGLFEKLPLPPIAHGVCLECQGKFVEEPASFD